MYQLLLDLLPDPSPTLANFVVGNNNEALTALRDWLCPNHQEKIFFLCGENGAGKSHLLRAVSCFYFDAEQEPSLQTWEKELTSFVLGDDKGCDNAERNSVSGQKHLSGYSNVIAVDQVGCLDGAGQQVLFNSFNAFKTGKIEGRLLVGDRLPPALLGSHLREDLRTRLGSALIYRLEPLSDQDKWTALKMRADARGINLPAGGLDYLFAHVPRDMRTLSALIDALDRYSLTYKRPITLPLLRQVVHSSADDSLRF